MPNAQVWFTACAVRLRAWLILRTCLGSSGVTGSGPTGSSQKRHRREEQAAQGWGKSSCQTAGWGQKKLVHWYQNKLPRTGLADAEGLAGVEERDPDRPPGRVAGHQISGRGRQGGGGQGPHPPRVPGPPAAHPPPSRPPYPPPHAVQGPRPPPTLPPP